MTDYINRGGSDTKGERPSGTGRNPGESAMDVFKRTPQTPAAAPTMDPRKGYYRDSKDTK